MQTLCHDPTRFGQGLGECGHEVTFLGQGDASVAIDGVDHQALEVGLGPRRSRAIRGHPCPVGESTPDLVLVEWPLLRPLLKAGVLDEVPWMLVDRSPQPDAGFLAASTGSCGAAHGGLPQGLRRHTGPVGTVVSEAHARRVRSFTKLDAERVGASGRRRFAPLPAGS